LKADLIIVGEIKVGLIAARNFHRLGTEIRAEIIDTEKSPTMRMESLRSDAFSD